METIIDKNLFKIATDDAAIYFIFSLELECKRV